MDALSFNLLCNIISSIVYDVSKWGIGKFKNKKSEINKAEIEKYIIERIDTKFSILCDSSVFQNYIKSPIISDTINNFILYKITGKFEHIIKSVKKPQEQSISEQDIIDYLTRNLTNRYKAANTITIPSKQLIKEFFTVLFKTSSEFIFKNLRNEELSTIYFINNRIDSMGLNLILKIQEMIALLEKSIAIEVVDLEKKYTETKDKYIKILRENHKKAHIYLLDTFEIKEFYVPPILLDYNRENNSPWEIMPSKIGKNVDFIVSNGIFDDWKYIFDKNNLVYITGGAGYGKSLFMKKLINDYADLNIINSSDYLVIYGELKTFFPNNSENPISMLDFLQQSMENETLIDKSTISFAFIEYYLKIGRCIILFDSLDEVEKSKRRTLHNKVVNYFKTQNPNNKICITSRNRGFIPEKEVEVFDIAPLDRNQIETYVDKIINLGKFDLKDKEAFLKQTNILVEKGFLNSFLILSLLINIYKAERELPENKLDLYQKCFEYIATRREKEKTQGKYDWKLIGPLMKDNTFMELSNMCLPNNSDIDKESIKSMLTRVYKSKFGSESETESAADEFLAFCSDRTELFVPSSGEDKFKFFHRSFFEYFYSQYIFIQYQKVEDIYENISKFDIDSEIFELTMAMLKQKNECRYQELIEYIFSKIDMAVDNSGDKLYPLNILILGMQVIDDELYKKRLVQFLINNYMLIIRKIENLHNQRVLIELIENNIIYLEQINDTFKDFAIFSAIESFVMVYTMLLKIFSINNAKYQGEPKNLITKDSVQMMSLKHRFQSLISSKFYSATFFYNNEPYKVINEVTLEYLDLLCKKCATKKKEANSIRKTFSEYLSLDKHKKEIIDDIFFNT